MNLNKKQREQVKKLIFARQQQLLIIEEKLAEPLRRDIRDGKLTLQGKMNIRQYALNMEKLSEFMQRFFK
jgi:hypothetical protein